MSAAFAASQQCGGITSPMKYRRSTSFPGKVQGQNALHHGNVDMGGQGQNNLSHGPIDINSMDDAREFMQYQVSLNVIKQSIFCCFISIIRDFIFKLICVCMCVFSFPVAIIVVVVDVFTNFSFSLSINRRNVLETGMKCVHWSIA